MVLFSILQSNTKLASRHRLHAAALAGVFVIVAAVLLFLGSRQFIGYDGYLHIFVARQDRWPNFWQEVLDNAHPPLFYVLLRLTASWLGAHLLAYRLISIVAMVASTWLLAAVVRRTTSDRALAIVAAAAFGLSYSALTIGIEVRAYSLGTAFTLAACVLYLDWLKRPAHRLSASRHLGFAFMLTAAVLTHYSAFFFMVAAIAMPPILALGDRGWRRRLLAKVSSKPAATAVMFGMPVAAAAIAYSVHVVRWAGRLFMPENMFDPTRETGAAFLLRQTVNLAGLLLPGGNEFVAGISDWWQWLSLAVLGGLSLVGMAGLGRSGTPRVGAVLVVMLASMVALNAAGGLAARYPYGGPLRHEFFLFTFAVAGFFTLLEAARRGLWCRFASRRLWVPSVACGVLASVALWTSTFRIVPEYQLPEQAQINRFKEVVVSPQAVLTDQFSFIQFFRHHHTWQWSLAGEWRTQAVRQVWLLRRDRKSLKVCRDIQWSMDMSSVASYRSVADCLEKSGASRVALFRAQWPPGDTSKISLPVDSLSAQEDLTLLVLVSDGGNVYAEFARREPEAAAGRITIVRATYGANCQAEDGNATAPVRRRCDSKSKRARPYY